MSLDGHPGGHRHPCSQTLARRRARPGEYHKVVAQEAKLLLLPLGNIEPRCIRGREEGAECRGERAEGRRGYLEDKAGTASFCLVEEDCLGAADYQFLLATEEEVRGAPAAAALEERQGGVQAVGSGRAEGEGEEGV